MGVVIAQEGQFLTKFSAIQPTHGRGIGQIGLHCIKSGGLICTGHKRSINRRQKRVIAEPFGRVFEKSSDARVKARIG